MADPHALDNLPDPTDRAAPWHRDVPAYLAWWRALIGRDRVWDDVRAHGLVRNYAEAVPSVEALAALGELGPLLEIGAGSGYWARLLQDQGVDVVPVDLPQHHPRSWHLGGDPWTEIAVGDHRAAAEHPDRALFVCWPPRSRFGPDLLRLAPQRTLALITDGPATLLSTPDPLYTALERGRWRRVRRIDLPTWPARFDCLAVWRR